LLKRLTTLLNNSSNLLNDCSTIELFQERGQIMGGKSFEELEVWKLSRALTKEMYSLSNDGIFARDFCLRDQIRRASVSIMSNIAEGFERGGNKEFIHFLYIAKASCGEVRSQLYVAHDQNYINDVTHQRFYKLAKDLSVKLSNFINALRASKYKGDKYKQR